MFVQIRCTPFCYKHIVCDNITYNLRNRLGNIIKSKSKIVQFLKLGIKNGISEFKQMTTNKIAIVFIKYNYKY